MRGLIKSPWKNFSRKVARNDLVRCVITSVNDDGSFDVRRVGVGDGMADIKRVPSVTKNDMYLVGDIASLGFAEGDPQKPFLFGFINGGAKHISVVVNPLPTPPEPELGEPLVSYLAPTTPLITRYFHTLMYIYNAYQNPAVLKGGGINIWTWIDNFRQDTIPPGPPTPPPTLYRVLSKVYETSPVNYYVTTQKIYSQRILYQAQDTHIIGKYDDYVGSDTGDYFDEFVNESPYSLNDPLLWTEFSDYVINYNNYYNNYPIFP